MNSAASTDQFTPIMILLVEDDEVDVEAVTRLLRREQIGNPIVMAKDGVEALGLLTEADKVQQPCLVLLDINMPRMNGFQFLAAMRQHPRSRENVVIMLTTSNRQEDRNHAKELQVAEYVLKEDFRQLGPMLKKYCAAA